MNSNKENSYDTPFPPADRPATVLDCFQILTDEGMEPCHPGMHSHAYHEILYCRSNCGAEFQLGSQTYQLQRGDILMLPPNTPHSWLCRSKSGEPYLGYRLCIAAEHLAHLNTLSHDLDIAQTTECYFLRTLGTIWEPIGEMFRVLYEETHFRSVGWEMASMASSIYLLTQLGRAVISNPSAAIPQNKLDLVELVLSYVRSHYGEKITLEDVARKFWVSPSTITHLFHKKLGISFYKYVMNLRLTEAKNLISEGMPMEKIALNVGFNDYSAFYRAFKKEFGISPRQFSQTIAK